MLIDVMLILIFPVNLKVASVRTMIMMKMSMNGRESKTLGKRTYI